MTTAATTVPAAPRSARLPELDALRGIAALSVVLYHYTTWFGREYGWKGPAPLFDVPWGHYGVNLFFVISGFVITASTTATPTPVDFAVNRAARIYPPYIAAVILASIVATVGLPGWDRTPLEIVANFTMLQRFAGLRNVDGPYWTLTVELMFYVAVAVGLATKGWRRPVRDVALLVWALASLAWAVGPLDDNAAWVDRPVALFLHYGPLFVAGILLREGVGEDRTTRALTGMVAGAVTAALVVGMIWSEVLICVGCVALVAAAVRLRPAALRVHPLVAIGEASYVLYLVHYASGAVLLLRLRTAMDSTFAALLVATLVVAFSLVAHRWFEVPINRWTRTKLRALTRRTPTVASQPRVDPT